MRLKSMTFLTAALLFAGSASATAAQSAADKLTPPKRNDWRSTLLTCADGKRMTALFAGQEALTVATPEGEYRLTRVKGKELRYGNDKAQFVVSNGEAQFTSAKTGEHKGCKPS